MRAIRKPRAATILRFRFGLDGKPERTLEEIGARFGLTRERIRQLQIEESLFDELCRAYLPLAAWVARPDWNQLLPGYARCVRILRSAAEQDKGQPAVDISLLTDPAERGLHEALQASASTTPASVDEFLSIVTVLIPAINTFFDKVLVMAEEEKVRRNRLALVGRVAGLSEGIADLSRLEGF
jgi:glycyl-tRNA synthetase beta subunit